MNLVINDTEYELLEQARDVAGEDIINDGLSYCRKMIDCKLFGEYMENIVFDGVYTYDSMEINAVAWHEGGAYCIAISYGFFIKTYNWFDFWKKSPKIEEIFCFEGDDTRDVFFNNCYIWSVMFVLSHEMCHILDGHCFVEKQGNKIVEMQQKVDATKNLFLQALEYDADFNASRICMGSILAIVSDNSARKMNIRNYLFALYNVFLLFAQSDGDSFDELMKQDFIIYDHPYPSIRINCCFVATMDYLSNFGGYEEFLDTYYQVVNDCIAFDRILMEHHKLQECLFTYAYTEKGAKQIELVYDMCRKNVKLLQKYANMPLYNYPVMKSFPVWTSGDV